MDTTTNTLLIWDGFAEAYVWLGDKATKDIPKAAGFLFNRIVEMKWATQDPMVAAALIDYAAPDLQNSLAEWKARVDQQEYLTHEGDLFIWLGDIATKDTPKSAGFRWNDANLKEWAWATADAHTAKRLIEYADAPTREKIEAALAKSDERYAASRAQTADLRVPRGAGAIAAEYDYRPYQLAAIDYALLVDPVNKAALIGDEPGMGKTVEGCGVANMLDAETVLVVCPANAKFHWRNDTARWLVRQHKTHVVMSASDTIPADATLVICNYDLSIKNTIDNQITSHKWDLVIVDEVHRAKNTKAARTKAVWGGELSRKDPLIYVKGPNDSVARPFGAHKWVREHALTDEQVETIFGLEPGSPPTEIGRYQIRRDPHGDAQGTYVAHRFVGVRHVAGFFLALSGTPFRNRRRELYPILDGMQPGTWGSYGAFGYRYCGPTHNGFGTSFDGVSNSEEFNRLLRERLMLRRTKGEVLAELPRKVRTVIDLQANGASKLVREELAQWEQHKTTFARIASEVDKAQDDLILARAAGTDEDVAKAQYVNAVARMKEAQRVAFEEMSRVRRELAEAKMPKVVEYVLDKLEEHEQIVVAAHHRFMVDGIVEALTKNKIKVAKIIGGMGAAQREAVKDSFNAGEVRVLVANIVAAGEAISLQGSSYMIFAELSWVPGEMVQMEDRLHGIGRGDHDADRLTLDQLVFDGSLDSKMAKTLVKKMEQFEATFDAVVDGKPEDDIEIVPVTPVEIPVKDALLEKPKRVPTYTAQQQQVARQAVACMCGLDADRTASANTVGWNRMHTNLGHSLNETRNWTPGQTHLAIKILKTYKNTQLDPEWVVVLWPEAV